MTKVVLGHREHPSGATGRVQKCPHHARLEKWPASFTNIPLTHSTQLKLSRPTDSLLTSSPRSPWRQKRGTVAVHLLPKGIVFLAGAKHHTIKVTATITVAGGKPVKDRMTLIG